MVVTALRTWCFVGWCACTAMTFALCSTAIAGSYTDSAHGLAATGVKRQFLSPYAQGNCAHCHEQHSSIDNNEPNPFSGFPSRSALFSDTFNQNADYTNYQQTDEFCFYCHADNSMQEGAGIEMNNYDYSRSIGGYPDGPINILATFNQANGFSGSNHNLRGIQNYAARKYDWFGDNSDPCSACHNPHRAQRNKFNLDNPNLSSISLPSEHEDLWGDGDAYGNGEQMNDYANDNASNYRSPRHWDGGYEPAASTDSLGNLIPDYNSFCLECHGDSNYPVTSDYRGNIKTIDWQGSPGNTLTSSDKHGSNNDTIEVDTRPPYRGVDDLVLSCCDCHDPHGSPNSVLIRRSINGEAVIDDQWGHQCRQCHMDDQQMHLEYSNFGGPDKPNTWKGVHHGHANSVDNPYQTWQANAINGCATCHVVIGNQKQQIRCQDCHGHGSFVSGTTSINASNGKTIPPPWDGIDRRTF